MKTWLGLAVVAGGLLVGGPAIHAQDLNTKLAQLLPGILAAPGGTRGAVVTIFTGIDTTTCGTAQLSNVSTTETDLCIYTLPANGLGANGQKLRVVAWGTVANNGDAKTVAVYFGSQKYTPISGVTTANVNWHVEVEVIRITATTQQTLYVRGAISNSGAFLAGLFTNPTETLTSTVTIKVTGQSGTQSGDVTAGGMYAEWRP